MMTDRAFGLLMWVSFTTLIMVAYLVLFATQQPPSDIPAPKSTIGILAPPSQ